MSPQPAYDVILTRRAERQSAKLPAETQTRIFNRLEQLATEPRGPGVKRLQGPEGGYRVRVGDYRAVLDVDDGRRLVTVRVVGHRRDVYRR